ncbi:hypothetical protein [Candidatus Poriferisocius sp.]|uniref:hypothetical protein n=1 Tax=Candidatus Poriferisocius sp. TaxID=3101276 RepID=UPI003B520422
MDEQTFQVVMAGAAAGIALLGWFMKQKVESMEGTLKEHGLEIKQLHKDHTEARVSHAEIRVELLGIREDLSEIKGSVKAWSALRESNLCDKLVQLDKEGRI